MNNVFLDVKDVVKEYGTGNSKVTALNKINFSVNRGEFTVIVGPSGAGKSTALNIIGGMDAPTSGDIFMDDTRITKFNPRKLTVYRRNEIGFVFQFYNLVQNLTALENVELATQICKNPLKPEDILAEVGLSHRMNNFPAQLSGGEQQRVAIARAIAKNPKLLLCDEPTGALDYLTGKSILKLLHETCKNKNINVMVITHNTAITAMADKVISIKNGTAEYIRHNDNPVNVESIEW